MLTLLAVINHSDIYDVVFARNSALQYWLNIKTVSLYDANKGVWNVHKKLIPWCFLHKKIQNPVTGSCTCFYNASKECSLCSGCFTVFSICVLCLALFPRLIAERLHWAPDSQFCLSTWKCDSAWKYNPVSAELPHWKLAAGFCSAPPGKCLKCATMAREMLGEAEMTCSFEKRWYSSERWWMSALPLHTRAQQVIFTFPPSSLWAWEESVAGVKEAVLLPVTPCCPSLPCPQSFPANQACLPCKAVLCNLVWEMGMGMLHLQWLRDVLQLCDKACIFIYNFELCSVEIIGFV